MMGSNTHHWIYGSESLNGRWQEEVEERKGRCSQGIEMKGINTFTEPQIVGPWSLANALTINTSFLAVVCIALCSCLLLCLSCFLRLRRRISWQGRGERESKLNHRMSYRDLEEGEQRAIIFSLLKKKTNQQTVLFHQSLYHKSLITHTGRFVSFSV